MRKLEGVTLTNPQPKPPDFKPYQLRNKKGREPSIERLTVDLKKLKQVKKKLDELNKKIRHSRNKMDGMIHKRNSLRRTIEEIKRSERSARPPPPPTVVLRKLENAFGRAYRSYRADGRPRMDVDTFFSTIRRELIELINHELKHLRSVRVQTTTWIRFITDMESSSEIDEADLVFNSKMTEVYRGSNLNSILDEMFNHMKSQIENPRID